SRVVDEGFLGFLGLLRCSWMRELRLVVCDGRRRMRIQQVE
ncbi:hypothetical protein A2U01_0047062, partial [Trifolium medium]|nr:hypothetical protein [Trifolium medium]